MRLFERRADGYPKGQHDRKEERTVDDTREFLEKLQEERENAKHNRRHAKGDPGKKLPNKRKGTMK